MTAGQTLYAGKAQLEAWLAAAAAGYTATYATGPALDLRHEVVVLVRDWIGTGEVVPVQRRINGVLHYQVQRRAAQAGTAEGPARRLRLDPDFAETAEGRLLAHLSRLANMGLPCPSNAVLAEAAGLRDKEAAKYRLGKLIEQGAVDVIMTGERRVVTIKATGKRTAALAPGRVNG